MSGSAGCGARARAVRAGLVTGLRPTSPFPPGPCCFLHAIRETRQPLPSGCGRKSAASGSPAFGWVVIQATPPTVLVTTRGQRGRQARPAALPAPRHGDRELELSQGLPLLGPRRPPAQGQVVQQPRRAARRPAPNHVGAAALAAVQRACAAEGHAAARPAASTRALRGKPRRRTHVRLARPRLWMGSRVRLERPADFRSLDEYEVREVARAKRNA